jgi:hypothetical protein
MFVVLEVFQLCSYLQTLIRDIIDKRAGVVLLGRWFILPWSGEMLLCNGSPTTAPNKLIHPELAQVSYQYKERGIHWHHVLSEGWYRLNNGDEFEDTKGVTRIRQ